MAYQLQERIAVRNGGLTTAPKATHVSLTSLSKSFGERTVLHDLTLEIAPGEFLGVIGKSGCGKSTLLRLLSGLDAPTKGQISQNGTPLQGLNPLSRLLFQDARLLPWKRVGENVRLGLTGLQATARSQAALEQVGLADRAGDWPGILSGGQRQRVALARALASEPPLLLLDEPLGALDALTRLEMQELIARIQIEQGFTALLVTHDVEEAVALCDRIILLEAGRIALDVRIDLPRPRERDSIPFQLRKSELLDYLLGVSEGFEI
ncbi:MAG: ATP-binding cassette domain-containing protein [Armatimonas sp.]